MKQTDLMKPNFIVYTYNYIYCVYIYIHCKFGTKWIRKLFVDACFSPLMGVDQNLNKVVSPQESDLTLVSIETRISPSTSVGDIHLPI